MVVGGGVAVVGYGMDAALSLMMLFVLLLLGLLGCGVVVGGFVVDSCW